MGISLPRDPTGKPGREVHLPWNSRDSKTGLWKWSVSLFLYGASARGTWREGSFTGNSESYVLSVLRDRLEN